MLRFYNFNEFYINYNIFMGITHFTYKLLINAFYCNYLFNVVIYEIAYFKKVSSID